MLQRYVLTDYAHASAGTRKVYDEFVSMTGEAAPPIWLTSLGHNTSLARAYWEKTKGSLLAGELPPLLKLLVVFVVSRENGASYCEARHAYAVMQLNRSLSYTDLLGLLSPTSKVPLPPAHRLALQFAARVAWDANSVDDEAFQALLVEGFSRDDLQELLAVIDMALMFNCYTSTLRLPVDAHYQAITIS